VNLSPGTIIAESYRVDRRIGAGGMGEVWAGERLVDSRPVALKILLSGVDVSTEVLARFRREAQVLARVRSEYVAEVLDFIADDDFGFVLVMDLIPGESLHAVLAAKERLSVEHMLDIASDVLRGLRDLHAANIVHRDLKPGNIVLRPRPNQRPRATLIDFGVSRIISKPDEEEITAITRGDRVLGTLEYMAPEQILGSRTVTGTADLYALGAMMFRAIAGRHVFGDLQEGNLAVAKLNEDAPPLPTGRDDEVAQRVTAMVARLLSRRLRDRYENAEQVISEVDEIRALARVRAAASDAEVTDDTTVETSFDGADVDPASISTTERDIQPDARAAIPMESEPPKSRRGPPPLPPQADGPITDSADIVEIPDSAAGPPEHAGSPPGWRNLVLVIVLFVVGSAGGGLFGISYAGGGVAYGWGLRIKRALGIAPPAPTVVVAPPATSAAPTAAPPARQFNLGEVPVPAGSAEPDPDDSAAAPAASSAAPAASSSR
jgi:serine/threonine protein kinase